MKINPAITIKELADIIKADFTGKEDHKITGINEIHRVEPGDLTFVDVEKYYNTALNSAATTILINKEVEVPEGKAIIISEDPFTDYNAIIKHFMPDYSCTGEGYYLHPSAKIGNNTQIFPGAYIGENVTIGDNCLIHPNVAIYHESKIGNNVIIHGNSAIGGDAFYFKRRTDHHDKWISCGNVIIEDDVEIGAGCTIDRGVSSPTTIKKNAKLDSQVHVGHDAIIGERCLLAAHVGIGGATVLEPDVILWGRVGVNKTITIGRGAQVLACSCVKDSLAGGKTYFGSPAQEGSKHWRSLAAMNQLSTFMRETEERLRKLES